jgi:hypothetical protein
VRSAPVSMIETTSSGRGKRARALRERGPAERWKAAGVRAARRGMSMRAAGRRTPMRPHVVRDPHGAHRFETPVGMLRREPRLRRVARRRRCEVENHPGKRADAARAGPGPQRGHGRRRRCRLGSDDGMAGAQQRVHGERRAGGGFEPALERRGTRGTECGDRGVGRNAHRRLAGAACTDAATVTRAANPNATASAAAPHRRPTDRPRTRTCVRYPGRCRCRRRRSRSGSRTSSVRHRR